MNALNYYYILIIIKNNVLAITTYKPANNLVAVTGDNDNK